MPIVMTGIEAVPGNCSYQFQLLECLAEETAVARAGGLTGGPGVDLQL